MDRSEVRKYQLAQLKLLENFDGICNHIGVNYFLMFGTLLGVVRDGGFIPWDVDIDVAMMRKDYELVKDYFLNQPERGLFYQHYLTEENHVSPHAILKVKGTHVHYKSETPSRYTCRYDGIYIDIFPIDNAPDSYDEERVLRRDISIIRYIISLKLGKVYESTSIYKRIAKKLISKALIPISFRYLLERLDRVMQKYNKVDTKRVGTLTHSDIYDKLVYPKDVFDDCVYGVIEGKEFPIPIGYDKILTIRYGNYRTLPPKEERWGYIDDVLDTVDYGNER